MDSSVARLLQDKLYDRRKAGALELEALIRNSLAEKNHDRIAKIVHQLCHDYAYAVHQPHARNGGLIGLAAASIALGSDVAPYLREIVPPVLACFSDQDARVRYYACESMYNIAKVAKGDILIYFNDVFDSLCKLAADTEPSVKNGAELLDRLVKDIVSESAAIYAGIMIEVPNESPDEERESESRPAFSLPRFIPLLQERINAISPFVRTFLVSWITLLDSIPDLELVVYLPSFLGGLLRFLSDPNHDVHTTTKVALDRFLGEIKKISAVNKGLAERKRRQHDRKRKSSDLSTAVAAINPNNTKSNDASHQTPGDDPERVADDGTEEALAGDTHSASTGFDDDDEKGAISDDDEWIPGQDVQIDYPKILDILVAFLSDSIEEEMVITTLKWIESFFDICPEDILLFTPKLLSQVLPALSHDIEHVHTAASRVNQALMNYVLSLPDDLTKPASTAPDHPALPPAAPQTSNSQSVSALKVLRDNTAAGRRESAQGIRPSLRRPVENEVSTDTNALPPAVQQNESNTNSQETPQAEAKSPASDLDYEAAVNALMLQFLHEHEATRVAALAWLIMLHRKSPRKVLAIHDGTFPALLKTLSDPAEAVVTRDLLLLSQISKNSDESYFTSFMVNLLKLFCTDRRLLETRGNLIIRQLCLSLSAERIYRTMADCLERDEDDIEFASIMVQNLNNNLITAPELQDLRKRLRNLDTKDGQTFFTVLFKAWCVNAVATFSLCLLAQAYEQAYHLLQIFAELEMTVNMLIQIDKLVQLLESPVFTYLRMQLLEPERYPHLYKCLYGLLMLLPQSSAFAALKNRLNSVSAIGYLHTVPRPPIGPMPNTPSSVSTFERQNRLKSRDEAGSDRAIRWTELLDKFRQTQEKIRRIHQGQISGQHGADQDQSSSTQQHGRTDFADGRGGLPLRGAMDGVQGGAGRPNSAQSLTRQSAGPVQNLPGQAGHTKNRSSLSHLGRLTGGKKGKR
ncbi:ARM repeat-containing protein [Polychaeton citri CBS 116435]|uniref:ARM repeat-containing protein n=1 Tax=Polychaeton citri CBS 116435 TaxID=1314669 RepID=A0A9P4Q0Q0_9PEZI|nr:ARM repeat-containing protein [Polychaeton citri CBS 116435]